jgi:hypothetical protein
MIADWLIILVAMGVLWAGWGILAIVFDLLERWRQPGTEGPGKLRKEKGSSAQR